MTKFITKIDYDLLNVKYKLKIHSKDRNLQDDKNPFNLKIHFNPTEFNNYYIRSEYNDIKSFKINEIILPKRIYTDNYGLKIDNITLIKTDDKIGRIIIEHDLINYTLNIGILNTISLTNDYINITLDTQSVLIINKLPYYIDSISNDGDITFITDLPTEIDSNYLYIATHNNANTFKLKITNNNYIEIDDTNEYIKTIYNKNDILYNNTIAIHIDSLTENRINFTYRYKQPGFVEGITTLNLMERSYIKSVNEKCYFLKLKDYHQSKSTSADSKIDTSIGIFYPDAKLNTNSNSTLILGDGELEFYDKNLKSLKSLTFILLDSRGNELGSVYNNFGNRILKNDFNNIIINMEILIIEKHVKS